MPEHTIGTRGRIARIAAALLAALAGITSAATALSPAAKTFEVPMEMHRGYSSEHCLELASSTLRFVVDSPYPVDFNIHHHTDTATDFPLRAQIEQHYAADVDLAAPGEYCFQWQNLEDRTADFTIRLSYETSPR